MRLVWLQFQRHENSYISAPALKARMYYITVFDILAPSFSKETTPQSAGYFQNNWFLKCRIDNEKLEVVVSTSLVPILSKRRTHWQTIHYLTSHPSPTCARKRFNSYRKARYSSRLPSWDWPVIVSFLGASDGMNWMVTSYNISQWQHCVGVYCDNNQTKRAKWPSMTM